MFGTTEVEKLFFLKYQIENAVWFVMEQIKIDR